MTIRYIVIANFAGDFSLISRQIVSITLIVIGIVEVVGVSFLQQNRLEGIRAREPKVGSNIRAASRGGFK
jgi:hypothetical protein